nr:unnamed protein product [Haemonchus contortus]
MLGILLALRLVIACNYKPPKPEEVMAAKTEYPLGSRSKRESPWDWILIKIEYDHSFNLFDEEIKEVVEQLVRGARHFFETTVKVHRLASLQLPPFDEEIKEVVEQLVRGARHFFETTVKVHRLASLQLPPWVKIQTF